MALPDTNDAIVAISTGFGPSPLGVIRLSGPDAFTLLAQLHPSQGEEARHQECGAGFQPVTVDEKSPWRVNAPVMRDVRFDFAPGAELPATLFEFRAPRSYTGQDLVEIHTAGCPPLLRELCDRLIAAGARAALPGEFTARAFLAGKLAADQAAAVMALVHAQDESTARAAARRASGRRDAALAALCGRLADLLALLEAGIDFVEEEDVRFISAGELRRGIADAIESLDRWAADAGRVFAARPHVALAGLPNAGKSTLFNALVGDERVIVSPVVGTTRDVVSCEVEIDGAAIVLQDCAGIGDDADGLEAAAHLSAQNAAQQADLVVWVHEAGTPWREVETRVCRTLRAARTLLVCSKLDLAAGDESCSADEPERRAARPCRPCSAFPADLFASHVAVSAPAGQGMAELRAKIAERIDEPSAAGAAFGDDGRAGRARASLSRALELCSDDELPAELIALELRVALEALSGDSDALQPDAVLGRIFSQFCVGK